VLYASVYNLFALLGRKATFTHSFFCAFSSIYNLFALLGRKAPFTHSLFPLPRVLSPFRGGGIVYLNDLDSYAGWSFIFLIGPPKPDRLKDRGQTKSSTLFFPIFSSLLSCYSTLLFLLFPCFTRPYITFLPCLDVKPLHSLDLNTSICASFSRRVHVYH